MQLSVAVGVSNVTVPLHGTDLSGAQVITGGVTSNVQVTVRDVVAVLPQMSVAVNILVCIREHVPWTGPVETVTTGVPHASVADALPNAASIAADVGLQPS